MGTLKEARFPWTAELKAEAGKLYADGASASTIAQRFNERRLGPVLTRNAVIGMMARLKIVRTPGARQAASKLSNCRSLPPAAVRSAPGVRTGGLLAVNAVRKVERLRRDAEANPPLPPAEAGSGPTLIELAGGRCKWPVGEATGADQRFCGAQRPGGDEVYCEEHAARARSAAAPRPLPPPPELRVRAPARPQASGAPSW